MHIAILNAISFVQNYWCSNIMTWNINKFMFMKLKRSKIVYSLSFAIFVFMPRAWNLILFLWTLLIHRIYGEKNTKYKIKNWTTKVESMKNQTHSTFTWFLWNVALCIKGHQGRIIDCLWKPKKFQHKKTYFFPHTQKYVNEWTTNQQTKRRKYITSKIFEQFNL